MLYTAGRKRNIMRKLPTIFVEHDIMAQIPQLANNRVF